MLMYFLWYFPFLPKEFITLILEFVIYEFESLASYIWYIGVTLFGKKQSGVSFVIEFKCLEIMHVMLHY